MTATRTVQRAPDEPRAAVPATAVRSARLRHRRRFGLVVSAGILALIAAVLVAAILVFSRRDFK